MQGLGNPDLTGDQPMPPSWGWEVGDDKQLVDQGGGACSLSTVKTQTSQSTVETFGKDGSQPQFPFFTFSSFLLLFFFLCFFIFRGLEFDAF